MTDDDDIQEYARPCPNCEYHRQRAQLWREEAYKQAGHPLPEREWVGLDDDDYKVLREGVVKQGKPIAWMIEQIEAKLKEKNT